MIDIIEKSAEIISKHGFRILDIAPSGKIETKEQYDYIIEFSEISNIGFYWSQEDLYTSKHYVPTFEKCKGKYLRGTAFSSEAIFFTLLDYYFIEGERFAIDKKFSYGIYGKLELCKLKEVLDKMKNRKIIKRSQEGLSDEEKKYLEIQTVLVEDNVTHESKLYTQKAMLKQVCGCKRSINVKDDGIYERFDEIDQYGEHLTSRDNLIISKESFIEAYNRYIKEK